MKTEVPRRAEFRKGDTINGKYTVLRTLGEGAFGQVYEVKDRRNKHWAFKLLRLWDVNPDIREPLLERFEMEFKTGQIDSKYLVHSIDFGLCNGNPFIVMEFCPGGDLTQLIRKDDNAISKAAYDILHGLYVLHINGKVHRDLKPENVLFKTDGTAALTDFGISGDRNNRLTQKGLFGKPNQVFGTWAYMPPEQKDRIRGATVLPTTDIFSFGVVIYQLLTGKLPFGKLEEPNDLFDYQKRGKEGEWDRASLLSLRNGNLWLNLIEGCLQPDFRYRLQSAKETIRLLPHLGSDDRLKVSGSLGGSMIISTESKHGEQKLRVMHGKNFGTEYNLVPILRQSGRLNIKVGRASGNDIIVQSQYASRFHCTLETDEQMEHWRVRDGQWNASENNWTTSSNGTFVNSKQVSSLGYWLEIGDILTIGDDTLRFE